MKSLSIALLILGLAGAAHAELNCRKIVADANLGSVNPKRPDADKVRKDRVKKTAENYRVTEETVWRCKRALEKAAPDKK